MDDRCRLLVLVLVISLLTTACAGRLTDEEILAASGTPVRTGQPGDNTSSASDGSAAGAASGDAVAQVGDAGSSDGNAGSDGEGAGVVAPDAGGGDTVGTPGERGPIVIASVGDYSGPAGVAQAGIPRGVQIWAAAVNARGGLFGREVQVIVQDDGGDPARYASAVRDLVENRGVVAFVGNGASLAMRGGTSYLESKGVPVIGSECSVTDWFESAYYFPQCPTYVNQTAAVMALGKRITGSRRFGFVACTEAAACTGQEPILRDKAGDVGVDIVYAADISLTQVDFTSECRAAKAAEVDMFFVAADPNTLARVARSCARQSFFPQYVQQSITAAESSKGLEGVGDIAVAMPVFPFQGGSGGPIDEYTNAYASFAGELPGPADAFGWAAGKLFEKIATDAARADQSISSATLLAAASKIEGETLGGLTVSLGFTAGRADPAPCYFGVQAKGGTWTAPFGAQAICD